MELTAYRFFNKRKNSTKRPSGGSSRTVVLLDDTSLYNPRFQVNYWDYNDNYVKWVGRYYYVTDVVCVRRDLFNVECEIDPFATWKDDILSTNAFVVFSTSDYDIGITDNRLSSDPQTLTASTSADVLGSLSGGYVVTYIGQHSTTNPTAVLDRSSCIRLMDSLASNAFASLLNDTSNAVAKMLTSTSDAITSCVYSPKVAKYGSSGAIVLVGGYNTGVSGASGDHNYQESISLKIPWHFPSGDFRNTAHFTSLLLYLPGYGFTELNADNYQGKSSISITVCLDTPGAEVSYYIDNKTKCGCKIGYSIQISTSQSGDIGGAIGGAVSAVGSAVMGNAVGASISAFNSIKSMMTTNPGSVGSMGGSSAFNVHKQATLVCISHNTNVDPSTVASTIGRPLNASRSIGSLSGYVQCANAIVPTSAPSEYKQVLNDGLNGGMYIE